MKAVLNFLPTENRKKVRNLLIIQVVNRSLLFLTILVIIFTLALYGTQYLLDLEISRLNTEQQNLAISSGTKDISIEDATVALNATTKELSEIQNSYTYWTKTLERFYEITSPGIVYESIDFNASAKTITIKAQADTRESYFTYEQRLQNSEYVSKADIPISLLKTDIPFNITISVHDNFFLNE